MTEPEKIEDVLAKVRTAIFALCDNPQTDDVGRAVCPCWKCAMCDLGHRIQYVVDALERERAAAKAETERADSNFASYERVKGLYSEAMAAVPRPRTAGRAGRPAAADREGDG